MRNKVILEAMNTSICCCQCIYSVSDGTNSLQLFAWSVGHEPTVHISWEETLPDGTTQTHEEVDTGLFLDNGQFWYPFPTEFLLGTKRITFKICWQPNDESVPMYFDCINISEDTNFTVTHSAMNTYRVAAPKNNETNVPIATTETTGIVKVGNGINIDKNGLISVPIASKEAFGIVKIGDGLNVEQGTISIAPLGLDKLGGVKPGENLIFGSDGEISVPFATNESAGVVQVGDGLSVDEKGVLSVINTDVALFEYEVLSDSVVKYNGTTFTFTAGSDGRISAVSTDSGEEFSPKLGGSTDISAHNAAFMAVAMLSKMAKAEPITDTLTETCLYRYNCDSVELSGNNVLWANQASGASDKLTFENSSVAGKYVDTTGGISFGSLYIDLTTTAINSKPFTLYVVVQAKGTGSAHCISFRNSVPAGEDLLVVDGKWAYQYSYESEPTVFEDCNADTLSAIAIVKKTTSKINVYINGNIVLENSSGARPMKGTLYFGKSATGTTDDSGFKFYDFAAADHEQRAEQVQTNLNYLMKKYKIGQ